MQRKRRRKTRHERSRPRCAALAQSSEASTSRLVPSAISGRIRSGGAEGLRERRCSELRFRLKEMRHGEGPEKIEQGNPQAEGGKTQEAERVQSVAEGRRRSRPGEFQELSAQAACPTRPAVTT